MTGRILPTWADLLAELHSFQHTAFRLELQDSYAEPSEDALFASWLAGQPRDPHDVPEMDQWLMCVEVHVGDGKRIERVRVQRDQPTDYQRFERWLDEWNRRAGERIRYLTETRAHEIGLLPAAGNTDWWLLDSRKLITMRFDAGRRVETRVVTDPAVVVQACAWRDLAVHYGAPAAWSSAAA